jgi:hypothetical protein
MSRTEDIDNAIWSDPDFLALTGPAKLVYIWTFTNPRCGMAGLYKVARPLMEVETGFAGADLDAVLAELAEARFAFYDGTVMWVRARVKRLRTKSPSIAKSIRRDVENVGSHPFVERFWEQNQHSQWLHVDPTQGSIEPHPTPSTTPHDPLAGSQGIGKGINRENSKGGRARARAVDPDQLPDDFPAALVAVVDEILVPRLAQVADVKAAKAVTRARCGQVAVDFPHHDHHTEAAGFVDYWLHGGGETKQMRDVVLTYRNRLDSRPAPAAGAYRNLTAVPSGDDAGFTARKNAKWQAERAAE